MIDLKFWHPREKFLILHVSPKETRGLLVGVDDERNIEPLKIWDDFPWKKLDGPLANLRKKQLIVAADSALTTIVSFPLELKRDPSVAHQPITLTELETLLAQGIARVFNFHRREASTRLNLHELDTISVNARASGFKVDRHLVMSPIGFSGKTIAAVLELTFTTRDIFETFKDFFSAKDGFFFTESARAGLYALGKIEEPPVNLALIQPRGTAAYILEKAAWGHTVHHEPLAWSLSSIFEAIAAAVPAGNATVLRLYQKFLSGDVSETFKRSLTKTMKPELDRFFEAMDGSKLRGKVYLHALAELPFALPAHAGRLTLHDIPMREALAKSGFSIDPSAWPFRDGEIFMRLAPFLEFHYDKSDSEINHRLRRRVHWLIQ